MSTSDQNTEPGTDGRSGSDGINSGAAQSSTGARDVATQPQPQPEQVGQEPPRLFKILKSLLVKLAIVWMVSRFFQRGPPPTSVTNNKNIDSSVPASQVRPAGNLFGHGFPMDMYVYVSENPIEPDFFDPNQLKWFQKGIVYDDWTSGPNKDSTYQAEFDVKLSPAVKNNGSLWYHVYLVRLGNLPYRSVQEDRYSSVYTLHKTKQLNRYKKRRYKDTHNLLTGKTDKSEIEQEKIKQKIQEEIISHWHPNMTINVVYDQNPWTPGSVPHPFDEVIEFEPLTGKYYPIVYLNDYWNLMRDYLPINETVDSIRISMTYQPLSLFKWQLYAAQNMRSKWSSMLGAEAMGTDEEQDYIKEALLETSPILLALTVIVSIAHSITEFMAFKNDIQFWKDRKSLEGLSVRSVFFNIFQSVVVLLYVLDNDTNTVIRISVGIGLLIELWKLPKVVNINIDYNHRLFGIFPTISFSDKGSYVESSTKQYDMLAYKYLSWVIFPLFLGYAIYSLLYQEHKGWYSFILNMIYGFLLVFGFIMMTPQLFINYKLKSVAHLPWRMLTYKFLNTFIDDIFAFVIKMPIMYRIGCFRDDIIFVIYLYQRWIYRVDPKRMNEFGVSGEELEAAKLQSTGRDAPQAIEAEYQDAINILQTIILDRLPSRSALSLLGYCHYMEQDYLAAENCYQQLCDEVCIDNIEYYVYYACSLFMSGKLDMAIQVSTSIEEKLRDSSDAGNGDSWDLIINNLQALVSYLRKDYATARTWFSRLGPSNLERDFNLAALLYHQEKYESAIQSYESITRAMNTDRASNEILYNIALNYYRLERYEECLKCLDEIIERGIRDHPELNVGLRTDGIHTKSVGNSRVLAESALIEALNLKFAVQYRNGDIEDSQKSLTDMPLRNLNELDPVTLHNQAILFCSYKEIEESYDKLQYLLSQKFVGAECPDETFPNLLIICCQNQLYDIASELMTDNSDLAYQCLSEDLYDFLQAIISQQTSCDEAYSKFDFLLERQIGRLRKLEKLRDNNSEFKSSNDGGEYERHLNYGVQILMSQAKILWDMQYYEAIEKLFRKTAMFFCNQSIWKINVTHAMYMQDTKYKQAAEFYEQFVKDNYDNLLAVDPMILANLCVSYVLTGQNEDAEELMRRIENEELKLTKQQNNQRSQSAIAKQTLISTKCEQIDDYDDVLDNFFDKVNQRSEAYQPLHFCIINLVIGTLYCVKFNYEFGLNRVMKSLEPLSDKLNADTWFYTKRCILSMCEQMVKQTVVISDSVMRQCIDFLIECEKIGLKLKASLAPQFAAPRSSNGNVDSLQQVKTITFEARHLRWLLIKILYE
ncbi:Cleft lip and palate transmembrane protein 1 [Fragariocoptes setiger]|uniref:Cleft lip and palate transmembrane protein 1 n=1 Tax=Fragariocoptes setiger TaxID=1670756 RepID=A0ABQ7S8W2_9ACAR|nr:Cleft lip and palate transmembrane protein 1 [Fragariocoptes setiger]